MQMRINYFFKNIICDKIFLKLAIYKFTTEQLNLCLSLLVELRRFRILKETGFMNENKCLLQTSQSLMHFVQVTSFKSGLCKLCEVTDLKAIRYLCHSIDSQFHSAIDR